MQHANPSAESCAEMLSRILQYDVEYTNLVFDKFVSSGLHRHIPIRSELFDRLNRNIIILSRVGITGGDEITGGVGVKELAAQYQGKINKRWEHLDMSSATSAATASQTTGLRGVSYVEPRLPSYPSFNDYSDFTTTPTQSHGYTIINTPLHPTLSDSSPLQVDGHPTPEYAIRPAQEKYMKKKLSMDEIRDIIIEILNNNDASHEKESDLFKNNQARFSIDDKSIFIIGPPGQTSDESLMKIIQMMYGTESTTAFDMILNYVNSTRMSKAFIEMFKFENGQIRTELETIAGNNKDIRYWDNNWAAAVFIDVRINIFKRIKQDFFRFHEASIYFDYAIDNAYDAMNFEKKYGVLARFFITYKRMTSGWAGGLHPNYDIIGIEGMYKIGRNPIARVDDSLYHNHFILLNQFENMIEYIWKYQLALDAGVLLNGMNNPVVVDNFAKIIGAVDEGKSIVLKMRNCINDFNRLNIVFGSFSGDTAKLIAGFVLIIVLIIILIAIWAAFDYLRVKMRDQVRNEIRPQNDFQVN